MKYLIYTVCLLTAQISVANIDAHLRSLNSEDYSRQMEARTAIKAELAANTSPGAPDAAYQNILDEIYEAIEAASTDSAKIYLIDMLGVFGDENSAAKLAALLSDSDPVIRDRARKALSALPGADAPKILLDGLQSGPGAMRINFMQALVYIDHKTAWEFIVPLLDDINPETQRVAAWALGKLGVAEALEPLWTARGETEGSHRLEVETAILQLKPDSRKSKELVRDGASSAVRIHAFNLIADENPGTAVSLLEEMLADRNFADRPGIISAAMQHQNNGFQSAPIDGRAQLTADEKIVLVGVISDQRMSQYESLLLGYLQSDETELARAAAYALGWVGGNDSFEALAAYTSEHMNDRVVVEAMGRLNAPAADEYYLSILDDPRSDLSKTKTAIAMVQIRNSPNGIDRLNEFALDGSEPELQDAAFSALETIGNLQSVQNMLSVILEQGPLTRSAQVSLKRLSLNYGAADEQWERAYLPALDAAETAEQKIAIIQILDGAAGNASLSFLADHAFDSELQSAVIRSLQRWPTYDVAQVWVKLSEDSRADDTMRSAAAAALRRTFNSSAMEGNNIVKAEAAADAIALSNQKAIKQSIASGFDPSGIFPGQINRVQQILEDFQNDPDVEELLAPLFAE